MVNAPIMTKGSKNKIIGLFKPSKKYRKVLQARISKNRLNAISGSTAFLLCRYAIEKKMLKTRRVNATVINGAKLGLFIFSKGIKAITKHIPVIISHRIRGIHEKKVILLTLVFIVSL
jgi:hypothetical protein